MTPALASLALCFLLAATPEREDPRVGEGFQARQALGKGRRESLFGIFRGPLAKDEREALRYLYAGMPLCDLADGEGPLFLDAVKASLAARRAVPWGAALPEDLFRAFVLPPRVNNEPLDAFRSLLHRELLARVKGLDMEAAALEINHWCHERVTYQGSDARTSAPLATLRTAFGRCGEESTFTVAALRSVCIPARQIYTPRWAHSDDNHAWVEAWVDGRWRFLGACEPEPALDRGWFKEPARRAVLIHAKAYGPGRTAEPFLRRLPTFTDLNLTSRYASVQPLEVQVRDPEGRPVPGAQVAFGIYNYAEFYPLATLLTGAGGNARAELGQGDLLVWAVKDGRFGFCKARPGQGAAAQVVLDGDPSREQVLDLDLHPPAEPPPAPEAPSGGAAHQARLQAEDRLRGAYVAAFPGRAASGALARDLALEEPRLWQTMSRAAGNFDALEAFLRRTPASRRAAALALLESLSAKDLRDTPAAVLRDHLEHCASGDPLVYGPRVDDELLTPWRGYLQRRFPRAVADRGRRDPQVLAHWIRNRIRLVETPQFTPLAMSPRGVMELRAADAHSRAIFFVALCRSLGIPARLDPVLGEPRYQAPGGSWLPARFGAASPEAAPATLQLLPATKELAYGSHFTLARFEGGRYRTLDLNLEGGSPAPFAVPPGSYLLVTGNRQKGGAVLARLSFFTLAPSGTRTVPVALRQATAQAQAFAKADPELGLVRAGQPARLGDLFQAQGAVLAWVAPGEEPTRHLMEDLKRLREAFRAWGGTLTLILPPGTDPARLGPDFQDLPPGAALAEDPGGALLGATLRTAGPCGAGMPALLGLDRNGGMVYLSRGYSIGAGDQVLAAVVAPPAPN